MFTIKEMKMAAGKAKKYRALLQMPNTTKSLKKSKIIWVGSVDGVNDSTRSYPRSLREAFPQDYSNPIEGPSESMSVHDILLSLMAIFVWGWLIMFFVKE
jgi:hypothetical protein